MRIALAFILILVLRCGAATTWNTNTVCEDCTDSIGSTYASLALWEDARDGDLVSSDFMEVCMIIGAWTATDASAVDFNGSTTDSSHYMLVYTTGAARHRGVFSTNNYFLSVSGQALDVSDGYVVLDGLQVEEVSSGFSTQITLSSGSVNIKIGNCLTRNNSSGNGSGGFQTSTTTADALVYNCLIVNRSVGGFGISDSSSSGSSNRWLNCTLVNLANPGANRGISFGGSGTKTNLVQNCIFSGWASNNAPATGLDGRSDYNSTTQSSMYLLGDSGAAHDRLNQTFTFVSSTDYHLSGTDAGARTYGTNLSGIFTTDFDGETRIVPWDIGADQTNATAAVSTRKSPFLRGFRR